MLLRASSQQEHLAPDLNSVTSDHTDPGVPQGDWLRRLTETTIHNDWLALEGLRKEAAQAIGAQQTIDVLTVAAAFNGITRVADATGIPLDAPTESSTRDMREQTGIQRFAYAEKSARYDAG
jgi:hypothetical protein